MEPLRVGLIGMGTVGTGVAKILLERAELVARNAGRPVELRQAVVRDLQKPRQIRLPAGMLSDDPRTVIDDPQIDAAVHLVGGLEPARQIMLSLLAAGKNVVTANKALLCEHGDEIFRRAREVNRSVSFEAAVAGGIPIINTLTTAMTANQITSIEAILNGTSNFILTEMLSKNRAYADVLAEAQQLGYAEADPSMDVNGTDAAQKLVILAQLAFGTKVSPEAIVCQGIDRLELADLQYAHELGYVVKLLAVAKLVRRELEMHVQPTLVRHDRPLAKVDGPFNMIALEGTAVGRTWYSGPGAGQMATASAVVADVIDVAVGRAALTFPRLNVWGEHPACTLQSAEAITRRYYLRLHIEDRPGVLADIAAALGRNGISIASVIQHEAPEPEEEEAGNSPGGWGRAGGEPPARGPGGFSRSIVPLVIMTHRTTEGRLRAADAELDRLPALRPPHIRMPVAD